MLHELVSMSVLKDLVQGRFVAKSLAKTTSAYEHCTDHQNYAFKVLAQTVETDIWLRYHEKTFSNAQKKEQLSPDLNIKL